MLFLSRLRSPFPTIVSILARKRRLLRKMGLELNLNVKVDKEVFETCAWTLVIGAVFWVLFWWVVQRIRGPYRQYAIT